MTTAFTTAWTSDSYFSVAYTKFGRLQQLLSMFTNRAFQMEGSRF